MSRRNPHPEFKFLLNINPQHLEVHDLDCEQTGANECQINEIINAGNARYLEVANNYFALALWLKNHPQYDGCKYCLPAYHRK